MTKILGLIGRPDHLQTHDGSAALIIDNKIVCAIEQERLTRSRYAYGQGCAAAAQMCLEEAGLQLSDVDYIAYGWLADLEYGEKLSENISISNEVTPIVLPQAMFGYQEPPPFHFVQHHYTHAAVTYFTSGFDHAAILIIDGQGEGEAISLYHAQGNEIKLLESYPIINSLGMMYGVAGAYAGLGWLPGPGKIMGLAPFGQVRQPIDFWFDREQGKFHLPPFLIEAIERAPATPTANEMGTLWLDYYEKHLYPYTSCFGIKRAEVKKGNTMPDYAKKYFAAHYDIANYVDFAATVQHTLETVAHSLAERLKDLTGENNLVLSGGCALNCSMNAYLSEQRIFDNLYVFPAANDAGCSIGAALALAHELEPATSTPARLVAPAFGRAYCDETIVAAIKAYGFTPEKPCPEVLAERVATDLVDHKIVAWFSGQDEFGPRALGRRSFMANPSKRATLGRLNSIKGREMWRPLAPSILDEHAATVLDGCMDRGLHRYMLGVAHIRPEWRPKVPAVVHVDFSTRPHFVERAQDGAYWQVINRFYEKTTIPLVCNTSLNVAGQPLVHTPEQVLEIFTTQADIHTLVIEGFYLTKNTPLDEKMSWYG